MIASFKSRFANTLRKLARKPAEASAPFRGVEGETLDDYVIKAPAAQNAVDMLPGWTSSFPPELGIAAGETARGDDQRVLWALEQFGDIGGKRILEIAPEEGWRAVLLDRHGPAVLDAVEGDRLAFLRCLVVKEVMGLKHASFHVGDARIWLAERDVRYDLVIMVGAPASAGGLAGLLEAVAARTDALLLSAHVRDGGVDLAESGVLERTDLMRRLGDLGFNDLRIAFEDPGHPAGPSLCVYARRRHANGSVHPPS